MCKKNENDNDRKINRIRISKIISPIRICIKLFRIRKPGRNCGEVAVPVLLELFQKEAELLHIVRLDVVDTLLRIYIYPHLCIVGRDHRLPNIELS
jgi:hypothetical protein